MKKSIITLVVLIVILLTLGGLVVWNSPTTPSAPITETPISAVKTVNGVFTCLPHRDTSGPQTMECAFGLRSEDGSHYALDWGDSATSAFDLPMDRKFSVTGLFVPIEALSTDYWQRYAVRGIIKVASYKDLGSDILAVPIDAKVTMELNKTVLVGDTSIRVSAVTQDSRCPQGATCIQAGKVTILLAIVSPSGPANNMELEPGQTATTETLSITLDQVLPYPILNQKTTDGAYRFVFNVKSR